MKRYTYVPLHINKFVGSKSEEHREIIDRYVGYLPTHIAEYGKIKDLDLIFERDE